MNLIDTADAYGPATSKLLIPEALHPYPQGLVIATKGGLTRPGPGSWVPDCWRSEASQLQAGATCPSLAIPEIADNAASPGTANIAHLEENMAAAKIQLSPEEWKTIEAASSPLHR